MFLAPVRAQDPQAFTESGVVHGVRPHSPMSRQGRCRTSHVPREPHCALVVLSDPGRTWAPSLLGALVLPPFLEQRRLQRCVSFGALSHDFGTGCLRFMPPLLSGYARLTSGGGQPFRVGLYFTH